MTNFGILLANSGHLCDCLATGKPPLGNRSEAVHTEPTVKRDLQCFGIRRPKPNTLSVSGNFGELFLANTHRPPQRERAARRSLCNHSKQLSGDVSWLDKRTRTSFSKDPCRASSDRNGSFWGLYPPGSSLPIWGLGAGSIKSLYANSLRFHFTGNKPKLSAHGLLRT